MRLIIVAIMTAAFTATAAAILATALVAIIQGGFGSPGVWVAVVAAFTVMMAVPCGILAVIIVVAKRKHPPGHCQRCGYDLTGNVSGRFPECGEEV